MYVVRNTTILQQKGYCTGDILTLHCTCCPNTVSRFLHAVSRSGHVDIFPVQTILWTLEIHGLQYKYAYSRTFLEITLKQPTNYKF